MRLDATIGSTRSGTGELAQFMLCSIPTCALRYADDALFSGTYRRVSQPMDCS